MNDPHDLSRLADIGDPFANDAGAPLRPMDPPRPPDEGRSSPTRARLHAVRRIAFAGALLYEVVYVLVDKHRRDLTATTPGVLLVGFAIPLAAAVLAFGAATRRGPRGLGLPARTLTALALGAPILFVAATLVAAPEAPGDPRFWRHAAGCAATTAMLTLGPLVLGLWSFRRSFATAAAWRTAALGVAAGALAAAVMSVTCPLSAASHVILGHGALMLVAGLAGAWLAPAVARS